MLKNMQEFILSLNFVLIYTNLSEKHVLLPKKYKKYPLSFKIKKLLLFH